MSARSEQRAYSRLETDAEVIERLGAERVESDDSLRIRARADAEMALRQSGMHRSAADELRDLIAQLPSLHGDELDEVLDDVHASVLYVRRRREPLDLATFERRLVWVD